MTLLEQPQKAAGDGLCRGGLTEPVTGGTDVGLGEGWGPEQAIPSMPQRRPTPNTTAAATSCPGTSRRTRDGAEASAGRVASLARVFCNLGPRCRPKLAASFNSP